MLSYKNIIKKLLKENISISIAESCTGGKLSKLFTDMPGISKIFEMGLITYSDKSKVKILNVPITIINKFGAVSKEVAKLMSKNLNKISKSKICVSITGIAGPNGGTRQKPVGLVYIGIKNGKRVFISKCEFKNKGRAYIQKSTVKKGVDLILRQL